MSVAYEQADDEVMSLLAKVIEKYHPDLYSVEVKIGVLMATAEKDEAGEPIGPAVKLHGYPCAAVVRIRNLKDRVLGMADAEILIDADRWEEMREDQRIALLDHETEHLEVKRDKDSNAPLSDDIGRPKLKMRKHDFDVGWFHKIAERHGMNSFEVAQARAFADEHGQLYFGWSKPPHGSETPTKNSGGAVDGFPEDDAKWADKELLKAARGLCPSPGSGVDAVEVSSGGKSVTLTHETRKNLDKAIRRIDASKAGKSRKVAASK